MADSDMEKILDKNLNDVQLDDFDIPEAVEDETDSKEYSTNIWVRGLDVNTQVADIKELFSQYGNVLSVKIISTGNPDSKVIALVTMSNNQETSLCITNLHNVLFKDINLSLSLGEKSVVSTTNINSNQTTEKSVPPKSVSKDSDSKPVNSYISRAFAKKLSSDYHKKRTYYITKKFVHDRKFSHPIKLKTHHRELNKPIFKDEAETTNINSFERALNSLHFQGNNILRNEKHSDERFSPQTSSMHRHASSSPFVVSTRKRMRNNDHHDYQGSKEAKFHQQPFNKTQLYGVNHTDDISFNTTRQSQQLRSQPFKFLPGKFESSRFQRNYGVETTLGPPPPPNKYFDKPFRHNFKENFEDHSRPWNNNNVDNNNNNNRLLKRRHHHNGRSSPDTSSPIKKQTSIMSGLKYLLSRNPQLAVKEERYAKFSTRAPQNSFPRPPQNSSRSRLRSPKAYSSVRRSAGSQAFKIDGRRNEVVKGSKGPRLGKLDESKSRTPSPVITFDRRRNHNDNNNNYYPLSQFSSGYKSGNDLYQGNRSSPFIRSLNTRHYDDTAAVTSAARELPSSSNRTSFTATTESLMPYRAYYNHENQGGSSYNHHPAAVDMFGKNVPKSFHDSRFVNNSGSSMQGLSSDNRYVRYIPPNSPGQDRMNALPYKRSFKPRGSGHMATNSSRYNHDPSGSYRNRPYGSIGDQTSSRRFGGSQSEVRSFFPRRGRGHFGSRYHKF